MIVLENISELATCPPGNPQGDAGLIRDAALVVANGEILWAGHSADLPQPYRERQPSAQRIDCRGRLVVPGLVDCHTHLVFGGDRAREFEQRLQGVSYEDIARQGGGILSTVRATRGASHEALLAAAMPRVEALRASGVATVEIKSGYGLDADTEIRMLEVARQIGDRTGMTVRTTLLAAHTVPPEYAEKPDAYIDMICDELIPQVADRGLADAVDALITTHCASVADDEWDLDGLNKELTLYFPNDITDDDLAPSPDVSISDASVTEGGDLVFDVTLSTR